jgi:hypothetical protein
LFARSDLVEAAWSGDEAEAGVGGYETEEPRSWRRDGDGVARGGGGRSELRWGFFILFCTNRVMKHDGDEAAVKTPATTKATPPPHQVAGATKGIGHGRH